MDLYHYSGSIQFNGFASESGSYYLMARNGHASRKSDPFTVTVTSPAGIPPVVRYYPFDATVNPGERVFLR